MRIRDIADKFSENSRTKWNKRQLTMMAARHFPAKRKGNKSRTRTIPPHSKRLNSGSVLFFGLGIRNNREGKARPMVFRQSLQHITPSFLFRLLLFGLIARYFRFTVRGTGNNLGFRQWRTSVGEITRKKYSERCRRQWRNEDGGSRLICWHLNNYHLKKRSSVTSIL